MSVNTIWTLAFLVWSFGSVLASAEATNNVTSEKGGKGKNYGDPKNL
jgi:hypothetical protein